MSISKIWAVDFLEVSGIIPKFILQRNFETPWAKIFRECTTWHLHLSLFSTISRPSADWDLPGPLQHLICIPLLAVGHLWPNSSTTGSSTFNKALYLWQTALSPKIAGSQLDKPTEEQVGHRAHHANHETSIGCHNCSQTNNVVVCPRKCHPWPWKIRCVQCGFCFDPAAA